MDYKRCLIFAASGVVTVYVGYGLIKTLVRKRRLQKAIRKRKQQRNETIEQMRLRLELADEKVIERRQWIISLSLNNLINELQNNGLKPVEVLEAFQWRAIIANDLTNCVCQFIVEANAWAEELENQYQGSDKKPPLYGVPISVKESIQVKGYDLTRGYAQFLGNPSNEDSHIVKLLRLFGAIPFVQTNIPQSLLSFNCSNPIYGQTSNPVDPNRTSGGSSGGEAALIASKGSILGIGGDVGGSIRTPAHYCGITGFKPSRPRLSQIGSKGSVPGRPMICASVGPMARDVDSLALFMKVLLCSDMYAEDPYVAPIPFMNDIYESRSHPLTIGYYDFDGFTPATPACKRAVHEAKEILERAGHILIKFEPPRVADAFSMFASACTVDGGRYLMNLMKNDIVDKHTAFKYRIYSIPISIKRFLRPLLCWISPDYGTLVKALSLDTSELREVYENIGKYRESFVRQWLVMDLDAIICPPVACTAMSHGVPEKATGAASYCCVFNLLDFPAGVVPVTRVSRQDEKMMETDYKVSGLYTKVIKNDMLSSTVGLPVGVQCAALPFREETCLRVLKEIEDGLKK